MSTPEPPPGPAQPPETPLPAQPSQPAQPAPAAGAAQPEPVTVSAPYYPTISSPASSGSWTMSTNMTPSSARWILIVVATLVPTFFGVGIWQFISHLGSSDPSTTVPSVFPTAPTGVATIPGGPASSGPSAGDEPSAGAPSGPVDVLSAAGYTAMRAAVRKSTGSTKIFEATIYPGYAVLEIPAGKSGNTQHFYRWDGVQLSDLNTPATLASSGRIDLASVRPAVVQQLSQRARKTLVKNATTWYVLVRTDPVTSQPSVYAYATNAAAHGGYLLATPAGRVTRKTTW